MKSLSWKSLFLILALAALSACGDDGYNSDDDDDDDIENDQVEREQNVNDFSTRINNNLLIAGRKCEGSETTTDANNKTVTCAKDQWLVTLDDKNTCSLDGSSCTEIGVIPFVAELDRSDRVELPNFTYFQINPFSAVTPTQENTIDDYLVRFDLPDQNAEVVPK